MNEKEVFEKWLGTKAGLTFSDCSQKYSSSKDQSADLLDCKLFYSNQPRKLIYRNNDYLVNLPDGQCYLLNYNNYAFEGNYLENIFADSSFYSQYNDVQEMVLTFQEMRQGKWLEDNKLQFILSAVQSSYSKRGIIRFFDCTFMAKVNGKKIGLQRFRLGYDWKNESDCKRNLRNINCLALVDSFLKEGELKRLYDKFIKRSVELPEPLFNLNTDEEIKEIIGNELAIKRAERKEKWLNGLKFCLFLPWTICKLLWIICKLPWRAIKGICNAYCRWQNRIKEEEAKRSQWFE